jgi:hypothetical protein
MLVLTIFCIWEALQYFAKGKYSLIDLLVRTIQSNGSRQLDAFPDHVELSQSSGHGLEASSDHALTIDIKSIHSLSDEGDSDDGDESRQMSPSRKLAKEARRQLLNAHLEPELHSPIRFPISPSKASPLKGSPAKRMQSNPMEFNFSEDENSDDGDESRVMSPSKKAMKETQAAQQLESDESVRNPLNSLR